MPWCYLILAIIPNIRSRRLPGRGADYHHEFPAGLCGLKVGQQLPRRAGTGFCVDFGEFPRY